MSTSCRKQRIVTTVELFKICPSVLHDRTVITWICHLYLLSRSTRWFKYDRDYFCVNKSQFVPVIFEPPCILKIQKLIINKVKQMFLRWGCKVQHFPSVLWSIQVWIFFFCGWGGDVPYDLFDSTFYPTWAWKYQLAHFSRRCVLCSSCNDGEDMLIGL